jgi:hypothetical protein
VKVVELFDELVLERKTVSVTPGGYLYLQADYLARHSHQKLETHRRHGPAARRHNDARKEVTSRLAPLNTSKGVKITHNASEQGI